ncbi:MAG: hypothetical protein MR571_02150 [Succinatimonas sp.]|nr:hypothetical protein [Succinatimonas sp.]
MYFKYGEEALAHLKKDKKLADVIDRVGMIEREVDSDLFSAVIHHIVGQQISTKAQATIWKRFLERFSKLDAKTISQASVQDLQSLGMTFKKAQYILDFASQVQKGEFPLQKIATMSDEEAVKTLSSLKGVGVWTAEMLLLFCLQRQDIFSFTDLAIVRGIRMLYRHRKVDKALFEKYRRRFSPYGSVASLYLWAVSGGALPELSDPAPKKKVQKKVSKNLLIKN